MHMVRAGIGVGVNCKLREIAFIVFISSSCLLQRGRETAIRCTRPRTKRILVFILFYIYYY